MEPRARPAGPVAIIGLAGRFPGAESVDELWRNIVAGVESISFFTEAELLEAGVSPALLADPAYVRAGALLSDVDLFDADFFGMNARDAEITDPQHRLFLECSWQALERAGHDPARFSGAIGVYAGAAPPEYVMRNLATRPDVAETLAPFQLSIGNDLDYLATRVAYRLDLKGPALTLQTACSTSLVAVHLACQALNTGDCDLAVAGGVSVKVPQQTGYLYRAGEINSIDGHCRAFDARATGTILGSGVGAVVLRRLRDAIDDRDHVHAVILGSAINNDGGAKRGITAPSVEGQAAVIEAALTRAGVSPRSIALVEAHGTATPQGDPVEVAGLTRAFRARTGDRAFCALGTVKSNVGHLDAAAGVTGLIKTALAVEHAILPPTLHGEQPNPKLQLADGPFYVSGAARRWTAAETPRRAGVSSFGFGGTNAHVILEEAPPPDAVVRRRTWRVFPVSARSEAALERAAETLAAHLDSYVDLDPADVAFTLQVGRRAFPHRRAIVTDSITRASETLRRSDRSTGAVRPGAAPASVIFMFPGQGIQKAGWCKDVYECEPVFKRAVDECAEILRPSLNRDLRSLLFPDPGSEESAQSEFLNTHNAQLALFTMSYSLAQLWMAWGVRPSAMIGYSVGEYVAACLAGVFSLEAVLAILAVRGSLMQRAREGAMLAVGLSEHAVQPFLGPDLTVSVVSTPESSVVSGSPAAVDALETRLLAEGISTRRLHVTRAFHSPHMQEVLPGFLAELERHTLRRPRIPFVSSVTGTWIGDDEPVDPRYWTTEILEAVRFAPGVAELARDAHRIFLEVGPGTSLMSLVRGHAAVSSDHLVLGSCRLPGQEGSDLACLLDSLGRIWSAGVAVDWMHLHEGENPRRVPLPTYPFERRRYWIEPGRSRSSPAVGSPSVRPAAAPEPETLLLTEWNLSASGSLRPRPSVTTAYVAASTERERQVAGIWEELLGIGPLGVHDNFFELGGHSLVAVQVVSRVREAFGRDVPLSGFLEAPTVAGLSRLVGATPSEPASDSSTLSRRLQEIERETADVPSPPAAPTLRTTEVQPHADESNPIDFSLIFFSANEAQAGPEKYRLVLESARFADQHGFAAVWTPERHFHEFGGLYPNPAVLGAALAMTTSRIEIRAGSVVVPLHHPVRIAEDWAIVDNLSKGRVALAFAAGFNPADFVLAQQTFAERRETLQRNLDTIRRLWRGESVRIRTSAGQEVDVRTYPRPVRPELPFWLATAANPEIYQDAGRLGAGVLTAMILLSLPDLAERIRLYRRALAEQGPGGKARIAVMLHTFLDDTIDRVRMKAREPLRQYLASHFDMIRPVAVEMGIDVGPSKLSPADRDDLMSFAVERYFQTSALLGTEETCLATIDRLADAGVTEIACLVDFGIDEDVVLESLVRLNRLRERVRVRRSTAAPIGPYGGRHTAHASPPRQAAT
jgi:natural product biosynthesis luciferase-like monooxygenase protein